MGQKQEYRLKTPKVIENVVVGAYHKIETGVVDTYKKIETAFVDTFLEQVDPRTPPIQPEHPDEVSQTR